VPPRVGGDQREDSCEDCRCAAVVADNQSPAKSANVKDDVATLQSKSQSETNKMSVEETVPYEDGDA